jgi:hypothetical protein
VRPDLGAAPSTLRVRATAGGQKGPTCSRVTVRPPELVCGVESSNFLTPEQQQDILRLHAAAFLRLGEIIDHEPGQRPVKRLSPTAAGEPPPVGHWRTVMISDRIILAFSARTVGMLSLLDLSSTLANYAA